MKRSPLASKSPIRRKSPMRAKPAKAKIPSKPPARKAKPGVAARQQKQRDAVRERSGGQCEAEVAYGIVFWLSWLDSKPRWKRCTNQGQVAAHIYPRGKNGAARDLPVAVIFACNEHNLDHYDERGNGVRVPLEFAQAAHDQIISVARDKPSTRAVLGPPPEKGVEPY